MITLILFLRWLDFFFCSCFERANGDIIISVYCCHLSASCCHAIRVFSHLVIKFLFSSQDFHAMFISDYYYQVIITVHRENALKVICVNNKRVHLSWFSA